MLQTVTFGVTQQMTPKCSGCPSDSYGEQFLCENGECKSPLMDVVGSSTNIYDLSADNKMCSMSVPKKDSHVYKRRKMEKDSLALLADDNTIECTTRSCTTFEDHLSLEQNGNGRSLDIPSNASNLNTRTNNVDAALEYEEPAEASDGDPWKTTLEPHSGVNDRWSSSVSSLPSLMKLEKKDAGECSSFDINITKPITELTSARDLCISVLINDGFLSRPGTIRMHGSIEGLDDNDANCLLACKSCGLQEDPLKMIICDLCEAAFHLSCCYPRIKELPVDEWYCLPCLRKQPKSLCQNLLNAKDESSEHVNQRPRRGLGHIESMLKDTEKYESGVRIGRDFQAEVPEWSGPTSSSDGYFDEPSELDPTEDNNPNGWKWNNQKKPSIGNWIQCRELIDTGEPEKPVVCGKWRRAPLFVVQTDNWDCSCSVLWDPVHADCAVPQELETDEVLKHLKYINMLKNRLVRNRKPS